jgi:uncharacterized protein YbaP (TraB family)
MRALFLAGVLAALAAQGAAAQPVCAGRSIIAELRAREPARVEAALTRTRDEFPHEGRLFRVERAGVPASWLFGTVHSSDPRTERLPAQLGEAMKGARVLAVELAEAVDERRTADVLGARLVRAALAPRGGTLDFLPPEHRRAVEGALAERGLPREMAGTLQPWFVNVLLAAPTCEMQRLAGGLPTLDARVASARPRAARIVGLETIEEQIATIRDVPEEVTRHSLQWTARNIARLDDIYATLIELYLEGRPAAVLDAAVIAGLSSEEDRAMQLRFIEALALSRDAALAERALPHLAEGNVVIAVGALHLSGREGLVARLRRAGYAVTRVE